MIYFVLVFVLVNQKIYSLYIMENFICKKCNILFATKSSLERHLNKKSKCDTITDYKCNRCNKYFKQITDICSFI